MPIVFLHQMILHASPAARLGIIQQRLAGLKINALGLHKDMFGK